MDRVPTSFSFVDVETTGTSATVDRIIEIAVIRVEGMKEVKTFHTLVNPGVYVPPFISDITGITTGDIEGAPSFEDIWREVHELTHESLFVAHNARFDYGFLKNEFRRLERPFSANLLCTVQLMRRLRPDWRKFNLDAVIEHFQFECPNRHRALDDCVVLWKLIQRLHQETEVEVLQIAINKTLKTPTLPKQLEDDQLKDLPDGPGVYLFYGMNDALLYVGKSKNLRDRIKSHFASDYINRTDQKISEQILRIETIKTAGELEALILESELIKERMPLFNRMLRYSREVVIARQVENQDGYLVVNLETVKEIEISNLEEIVGVFRSKKQAQNVLDSIREKYNLCPKLLGLEKGKGSCFQYQLGNCPGACVEKEMPLRYNLRVAQSFANLKIKRWPFGGPVLIKEKNDDKEATHVVYQWCYLGKLADGEEIPTEMPKSFDYDTYKILVKWILEEKGKVEELGQKKFENQRLGFLENEVEYDREYCG